MHYPINKNLKLLLDKILTDERWDLKFIGMQIVIEGLALAAFQMLKGLSKDPLLTQLLHYVIRDEARHVTFGINYLEDFIKTLSPEEIEDRAEFAYEACVISRERLINTTAMQKYLKMSEDEAREFALSTSANTTFRNFLFSRIMPNLSRIGLLTDKVRPKFEALGLLEYENAPDDFECDWDELEKPLEKFGEIPQASNQFIVGLLFFSGSLYSAVQILQPSENAYEDIQEALILAEPGDVIRLTAGIFHLQDSLSLDIKGVQIEGEGMDQTILNFSDQQSGAQGLSITSDNVTLQDFSVQNAKGDAIKVKGVTNIKFLRVKTEWTNGPSSENGAYGLYPVESTNVLIDGCVAIGASDAGIYVGQSKNIIVRNSRAEFNVAGIEIENSYFADVHNNIATNNTGGILVFDLPGLPQQGGHHVRVFQ
jgi:parallel beta-helix repeat protein